MIKKKADIYFEGDIELTVSIPLEGCIDYMFCQIAHVVEKYGQDMKLRSIFFREEEINE